MSDDQLQQEALDYCFLSKAEPEDHELGACSGAAAAMTSMVVEDSPSEEPVLSPTSPWWNETSSVEEMEEEEKQEEKEDQEKEAGSPSEVDQDQVDLYFHQLNLDKATPTAKQASSSAGASMEAPSADTSSSRAGSAAASADVYSLPGQEWTEEDWQIWREVLKCSGKNRGQKRKQEMFRRFKFLRQQGEWAGDTPHPAAKKARLQARPKSSAGKP